MGKTKRTDKRSSRKPMEGGSIAKLVQMESTLINAEIESSPYLFILVEFRSDVENVLFLHEGHRKSVSFHNAVDAKLLTLFHPCNV